ncbi:uncharacterized protein LOC117180575 [Belonocnema kinseyi]|uniref:uncharacterized protein LOC117180575 n=1 Tax=Belonocnema kinseyi TaxID=2817044 RepID=UPI00143D07FD|nr:uncharacterized protein LOC117180575 [Belonocnema kinseyi]
MRIIVGTVCLTTAVLLNSIELSLESNSPDNNFIRGNNNNRAAAGRPSRYTLVTNRPQSGQGTRYGLFDLIAAQSVQRALGDSDVGSANSLPPHVLANMHAQMQHEMYLHHIAQPLYVHQQANQRPAAPPSAAHQLNNQHLAALPTATLQLFDERPAAHLLAANQLVDQHAVAQNNHQRPNKDDGLLDLTMATRGHH